MDLSPKIIKLVSSLFSNQLFQMRCISMENTSDYIKSLIFPFQRKFFYDELVHLMSVLYQYNTVVFIQKISRIIYQLKETPDLQKVGETFLTLLNNYCNLFFQKFVQEFKTISSDIVPKHKLKDFHSVIYMDLMISLIIPDTNLEVADIFQLMNNVKKLAVNSLNAAQKKVL